MGSSGEENEDFLHEDIGKVHKLVEGINLNDFLNENGVVFQVNDEYDEIDWYNEVDEAFNLSDEKNDSSCEANLLDTNISFSEMAASMINLDDKGYVKKEIITSGLGGPTPPPHSQVCVHYNLYEEFTDEPFDSTYLRGRPCTLRLDNNEIIVGLEMAIKSMEKKENSKFIIKWEAGFGRLGCPPRIGKEADILADVTLINFKEIDNNSENDFATEEEANIMSFKQFIKEAKNYYSVGSEHFRSGNFKFAAINYQKALNILNDMRLANEEEEEEMLSLKVKLLLNLALSCNKMGKSEKSCKICREILSIDPSNVKAMFYYGKANLHLSNFEIAEKWLKRAQEKSPLNKDINDELEKLHIKKETFQFEHKLFCQKAFGFNKEDK